MDDFRLAWSIYENSFPEDERRSMELHKEILEKPYYHFKPLYDNEKVIGVLATWKFEDFIFVEHFAIHTQYRRKEYGKRFLKSFFEQTTKKLILEVEKPETEIAKRRIKFYERLNIHLNNHPYVQPPYGENKKPVPMMIMTYPNPIDEDEFNRIKDILYREVYLIDN